MKNMNITAPPIIFITMLFLLSFSAWQTTSPVHAQGAFNNGFQFVKTVQGQAGIKDLTANSFITAVVKVGLSIMGLIAVAVIIYGGFLYVTSMGDEKKAEQGKHAILYAVIGLIIIGGAAILTNVIISTFKK
jgi:hypothetical protein